ncbi:IS3 family transposase [Vagococcus sp.]
MYYSFDELKSAIKDWIYYYNNNRVKMKLGGLILVDICLKMAGQ